MCADKYRNFEHLKAHEVEGTDFAICVETRDGPVAVIAPHGGKIETGTSQIATAIAAGKHSLYSFEGHKKTNNRDLHITSANFDEPRGRELVARCDTVVAVHGLEDEVERIDIGGLDQKLRDRIAANLQRAGFKAGIVTSGPHAAISGDNICNRGRAGAGAQLEITRSLRDALKADEARLEVFARAVQDAIDDRLLNS
jgi:phage replication-related protein YjqB (UPF0714/DUF867 family)